MPWKGFHVRIVESDNHEVFARNLERVLTEMSDHEADPICAALTHAVMTPHWYAAIVVARDPRRDE
jgi:hypothetical protein